MVRNIVERVGDRKRNRRVKRAIHIPVKAVPVVAQNPKRGRDITQACTIPHHKIIHQNMVVAIIQPPTTGTAVGGCSGGLGMPQSKAGIAAPRTKPGDRVLESMIRHRTRIEEAVKGRFRRSAYIQIPHDQQIPTKSGGSPMLNQTSGLLASLSNIRCSPPCLEVTDCHVKPNSIVIWLDRFVIQPIKSDISALGRDGCLGLDSQFVTVVIQERYDLRSRWIHQIGPEVATASAVIQNIV